MDQFPSNSRSQPVRREEPHKVKRIVQSTVVRQKTPLGRRVWKNLFGGDVRSIFGYVAGDIIAPAFRDLISDAAGATVDRALFGESAGRRGRYRGASIHTPYNRYSSPNPTNRSRRDEERGRDMSPRGRAIHDFDEIIIETRAEAQEVLLQLDDHIAKYDAVSVADLYEMVGISANFTDAKWGWTDIRSADVTRLGTRGYLLNLPKPEIIN